jgi:hypothetical protein
VEIYFDGGLASGKARAVLLSSSRARNFTNVTFKK